MHIDRLGRALAQVVAGIVSICALGIASSAQAAPLPLRAGTYSCFTITAMQGRQPLPTDLSEINRKQAGVNVRPVVAPQVLLAPAVFGTVILDGKGGYRMPTVRQSGRYGFDASAGRPTFTGDLGQMKQGEYSGTGTSFIVGWQGVNYQCSLIDPAAVAAARSASANTLIATAGPALATATAGQIRGNYNGSYICGTNQNYLKLVLNPKSDGTMTAVFSFGGLHTPEAEYFLGSFALTGTWSGSHFKLHGSHWIKQPAGYSMVDLEGDLTSKGVSGTMPGSPCSGFAAFRER